MCKTCCDCRLIGYLFTTLPPTPLGVRLEDRLLTCARLKELGGFTFAALYSVLTKKLHLCTAKLSSNVRR